MTEMETIHRRVRTAAERKRDQRVRQAVDRAMGKPKLTAENMQAAIMDALSLMLHRPDQAWLAEAVLHHAGYMLADSKRSRAEIRRRLMRRLPKVYKDQ